MNADFATPDEAVAAGFDAAAAASALVGTWGYAAAEEPGGVGHLHFSGDGRAVHFVFDAQRPERRIPLEMRFIVELPGVFRLFTKGSQKGTTLHYQFDGVTLTLFEPKYTRSCSRVPPEEVPEWFREALAKRLSRPPQI